MHTINRNNLMTIANNSISTLFLILFIAACDQYPVYPTPREALTGTPGQLGGLTEEQLDTVLFLQEKQISQGRVFLYTWQRPLHNDQYQVATTFVAPEQKGWRSQSSGSFTRTNPITTSTNIDHIDFTAAYTVGGNITPLSTAYGVSNHGHNVRIQWSDGIVTHTPLLNNSFLAVRTTIVHVHRIEVLDSQGNSIKQLYNRNGQMVS